MSLVSTRSLKCGGVDLYNKTRFRISFQIQLVPLSNFLSNSTRAAFKSPFKFNSLTRRRYTSARRREIAADGALSAADRERARALLAGGGDAASNPASPESRK